MNLSLIHAIPTITQSYQQTINPCEPNFWEGEPGFWVDKPSAACGQHGVPWPTLPSWCQLIHFTVVIKELPTTTLPGKISPLASGYCKCSNTEETTTAGQVRSTFQCCLFLQAQLRSSPHSWQGVSWTCHLQLGAQLPISHSLPSSCLSLPVPSHPALNHHIVLTEPGSPKCLGEEVVRGKWSNEGPRQ